MRRLLILAAALPFLLVGCEELGIGATEEPASEEENLPPANVNLPEVPPLELLDIDHQYDDESWSVIGIYLNREDLRGQTISLTAVVDEVYVCDSVQAQLDARTNGEAGALRAPAEGEDVLEINRAGCLRPHFYVRDNMRSPQRMLVVGYEWEHYEPQLVVGTRLTYTGRYAQQAHGHTSPEYGLIVADEITGPGILPPPDPNAIPVEE